MVKYIFKLKESHVPDLTHETKNDKLYGGIRLKYYINKVFYLKIFNMEIPYYIKKLGAKTFFRPYRKYWDKRTYRLSPVYWGKKNHPLTRLWMIIDDTKFPLGSTKIIPEVILKHQFTKIFNAKFVTKNLTVNLFDKNSKFSINNN